MRAIIVAHGLDLATFALVMAVLPLSAESNPLARALFAAGGMAALVAWKVVGVSLVAIARQHVTFGRTAIARFSVAVGIFGATMNTASFVLAAAR